MKATVEAVKEGVTEGQVAAGAEEFWRSYVSSGPRTNICRTVCVGKPTAKQQAAYDLYLEAQQSTIAMIRAGVGMVDLEQHLHRVLKDAGHGNHVFGPPIHGVGIEFEEAPLPPGHAFFHGEKAPPPLSANMVISEGGIA